MNAHNPFAGFEGHHYIALTTFRRSGSPVVTPVWFVQRGEHLIVWTSADSGKVKRLRKNPSVRLGPGNHSGKLLGRVVEGQASFVPDHEAAGLKQAFQAKYGWLYGLFALIWKLQRQAHTYIMIGPAETVSDLSARPEARADALHPVSA
jgi:uncharacterized protein